MARTRAIYRIDVVAQHVELAEKLANPPANVIGGLAQRLAALRLLHELPHPLWVAARF